MRFGLCLLLSALLAPAQSLEWRPNSETNLLGYNLYTYGPTSFVAPLPTSRTNYSVRDLPYGQYHFLLTAFNADAESNPAGPLFWTNSPPTLSVIVHLQSGANLTQWTNIFSITNFQPANTQAFYRALMEIKR